MFVNAKMVLLIPFLEWGQTGIKESSGGVEFNYDIFDTL
jgi:hypothetical protein